MKFRTKMWFHFVDVGLRLCLLSSQFSFDRTLKAEMLSRIFVCSNFKIAYLQNCTHFTAVFPGRTMFKVCLFPSFSYKIPTQCQKKNVHKKKKRNLITDRLVFPPLQKSKISFAALATETVLFFPSMLMVVYLYLYSYVSRSKQVRFG